MHVRPPFTVLCATSLAALAACVSPPQSATYSPEPAQASRPQPVYAEYGQVVNIGYVPLASRTSGGGAILGAVIGGVIGHQLGGGTGKALATGAGVIGGAVAGNAIEGRNRRDDEVYRVQVRFDNGSVREYDFQRIDNLRTGDRVKFEAGQLHRL